MKKTTTPEKIATFLKEYASLCVKHGLVHTAYTGDTWVEVLDENLKAAIKRMQQLSEEWL